MNIENEIATLADIKKAVVENYDGKLPDEKDISKLDTFLKQVRRSIV